MVEKSGVEKSFNLPERWHFNPGLFNHELFSPMVQKFMVEKSGVKKLMVEKSGVEWSGVEAWGWNVQGWEVLQPLEQFHIVLGFFWTVMKTFLINLGTLNGSAGTKQPGRLGWGTPNLPFGSILCSTNNAAIMPMAMAGNKDKPRSQKCHWWYLKFEFFTKIKIHAISFYKQCVKEWHSFERRSLAPLPKSGAMEECHSFLSKGSMWESHSYF
jgi:hypothetical protein